MTREIDEELSSESKGHNPRLWFMHGSRGRQRMVVLSHHLDKLWRITTLLATAGRWNAWHAVAGYTCPRPASPLLEIVVSDDAGTHGPYRSAGKATMNSPCARAQAASDQHTAAKVRAGPRRETVMGVCLGQIAISSNQLARLGCIALSTSFRTGTTWAATRPNRYVAGPTSIHQFVTPFFFPKKKKKKKRANHQRKTK